MTYLEEKLIITLAAIGTKHHTRSVQVCQDTILRLWEEKYDTRRCRRTLCRAINEAASHGLITVRHTTKYIPGQGRVFCANVYSLTKKAWKWLASLGYVINWIFGRPRVQFPAHNTSFQSGKYTKTGPERSEGPRFLEENKILIPGTGVLSYS